MLVQTQSGTRLFNQRRRTNFNFDHTGFDIEAEKNLPANPERLHLRGSIRKGSIRIWSESAGIAARRPDFKNASQTGNGYFHRLVPARSLVIKNEALYPNRQPSSSTASS